MSPVHDEFRRLLVVALIGPSHFPIIPANDCRRSSDMVTVMLIMMMVTRPR